MKQKRLVLLKGGGMFVADNRRKKFNMQHGSAEPQMDKTYDKSLINRPCYSREPRRHY